MTLLLIASVLLWGGCSEDDEVAWTGAPLFEVKYDSNLGRLIAGVHPGVQSGQTFHVRVRNGKVGVLNCTTMLAEIPRVDTASYDGSGVFFVGPVVQAADFHSPYDTSWLEVADDASGLVDTGPTAEMIAAADAHVYTIDLCLMSGSTVVRQAEMDIARALDGEGTGKFDEYGEEETRIESVVNYAQACVAELGEIPFFPEVATGDYQTYSCLDSVPIPTTVTDAAGHVTYPSEQVQKCDNPQYIYSLCEPNAVNGVTNGPRVARRTNEQGTDWIVLCRKSKTGEGQEGQYNDIAMIGHNPYTGKTCYFQNALYSRTDGLHVPHPGDDVNSALSPEQSPSLWSGIQGGLGTNIQCTTCHDSDPWIHTPWIDGALDERGEPVIPKMGVHDGYVLGNNAAPYTLVNSDAQGWTYHKVLASEEAAACTKCHRVGAGRWSQRWISRLVGGDTNWKKKVTDAYLTFEHVFWMPPEIEGLDFGAPWEESEYGKAVAFIRNCVSNSDAADCDWVDLPTEQVVEEGELPEVELEGAELATEALKVLGANVLDSADARCQGDDGSCRTQRCAECHSVSKNGLKHWLTLHKTAKTKCKVDADPETMTQAEAMTSVNCLRAEPDDPSTVFAADKVGPMTTGARYGKFRKLFQKAFGDYDWLPEYVKFKARVSMPKGTYSALSQMEYAVVEKWFDQGLPNMNDVLVDPPAPTSCINELDSNWLPSHISEMEYEGWDAANKENPGIFMFGCPTHAESPKECLQGGYQSRAADWGNGLGDLKQLLKLNFKTSFWTRSSADGRFVGNGGNGDPSNGMSSTVTDLVRGLDIGVKASYDPGFFPDNTGFIYQGGGPKICAQSMLETATKVDFTEASCMKGHNINLYQHVARGLNGGDYFIINSQFTSDSGKTSTTDPRAAFNAYSAMKFTPMIFTGQTYEQLKQVSVDSPFEGDSVLSPSGRMVISRIAGPEGVSLGYRLRRVVTEKFQDSYIIKVDQDQALGTFCFSGAKANISYDERFFVTHHHDGAKSNIILVDLTTGLSYDITNMPDGSRALFPHFRSDGWFYFLVRSGEEEFIVASDYALILGKK
jgi:hypothetical protein